MPLIYDADVIYDTPDYTYDGGSLEVGKIFYRAILSIADIRLWRRFGVKDRSAIQTTLIRDEDSKRAATVIDRDSKRAAAIDDEVSVHPSLSDTIHPCRNSPCTNPNAATSITI